MNDIETNNTNNNGSPRDLLRPEVRDLTSLVEDPMRLEVLSENEIRELFLGAGYRKEREHEESDGRQRTYATIITQDKKILSLALDGGKRSFAIDVLVANTDNPTPDEIIQFQAQRFPTVNPGRGFQEWFQRVNRTSPIQAQVGREIGGNQNFMQRMFRRIW